MPQRALATICSSPQVDINYEPKFFFENPGKITFNFDVKNSNTLNNLSGKKVWVHFGGIDPVPVIGVIGIGQDYVDSNQVTVNASRFTLEIDDDRMEQRKNYSGSLHWEYEPGKSTEYCSQINYTVGTAPGPGIGSFCTIDSTLSKEIPPGSKLTIKFVGKANAEYKLTMNYIGVYLGGGKIPFENKVITDAQGQGVFSEIPIPGENGKRINLTVGVTQGADRPCYHEVLISSAAPTPGAPPTGPIVPTPPGPEVKQCKKPGEQLGPGDKPCTTGGGISCDTGGIATAIGCIHTQPAALVKDVLKFLIGIAGGIALLLMALGAFGMITSAGNPESLQAGKDRFTQAFIGLLFVVFSVLLLQLIGYDILGIPGFGR